MLSYHSCYTHHSTIFELSLGCLFQIEDSGTGQQIKIEKRGFPDAVLWNPWIAKSKGMADFGDEEYKVRSKLLDQSHKEGVQALF